MPKQRERYSNGGTTGGATGPRPIKGFLKKVTSTAINKSPAGQAINVVGNTVRVARGKVGKGPVNVGRAVTSGRLGSRIKARRKARKAAKKAKT